MRTGFLNIVLIFSLIFSTAGVSCVDAFCSSLQGHENKSCCSHEQTKHNCCSFSDDMKVPSAISVVNASIDIPDVLLFAAAILHHLNFSVTVLDKAHANHTYSPPLITPDISVLNQVFRI